MKRLFYFMLSLVAFVGCTESETDNTNNQGGGNTEPAKTELTVNVTDLSFDAEADIKTIDISSSDAWTAEFVNDRASEWCSLSPTSGQAGNSSILVNVTENNSGEERSASIIIKAKSLQKIVKVTQKQNDAITVTSSKFEVKAEGGEVEIEVKANVDYDYSIEESAKSWVTYKTTRAMESSTLVFDVAENSNIEKREAKITLKSGDIKEVVTIYQEGTEYAIILSKNEYTVSDKGETIAVEVKSNVDVAVEIPSDVDWVKENSTRAMSTNTYYFEVSPNEDYNSRSTSIKFTSKDKAITQTVKVVQDAATPKPKNNEIWYTSTDGNIVTPNATDVFGANIVSNTYENGKGIITFDGDVTEIGRSAFWRCSSLTSITIPDSVTTIGDGAFYDCSSLISITIPDSVTSIGGEYAFRGCSSLTNVTIGNSVTSIGYAAFYDCSSLTSVTIPDSVTKIGNAAFYGCSSLTNVTIGNSVTVINRYTFYDCSSLTTITIPDSVTTIGECAFKNCRSLTSVTIGNSVTEIGEEAFKYCCSLTSVTIGNSVTTIGHSAFYECSSLTSVNIPDSVTSIGGYAFLDCSSLTSVYCKPTTPPSGSYLMFHFNASGRKIYVPKNSVAAYKAASGWEDYADIIVGYDFNE